MIIAKQYKTAKSRKISFDCETHSLSNDNNTTEKESGSDTDTDNPQKEIEEDVMIPSLDDIRDLRRGCRVPREGLMCDLLWADPQVI